MQAVEAITQDTRNTKLTELKDFLAVPGRLTALLFGCWHLKMSRPFTRDAETYRSCLECGARGLRHRKEPMPPGARGRESSARHAGRVGSSVRGWVRAMAEAKRRTTKWGCPATLESSSEKTLDFVMYGWLGEFIL